MYLVQQQQQQQYNARRFVGIQRTLPRAAAETGAERPENYAKTICLGIESAQRRIIQAIAPSALQHLTYRSRPTT
jgi:hypothetical protein